VSALALRRRRTDILILGAGGAGLFAALHAHQAAPQCAISIAVKGLLGKCGCTRMVQGGYNVALAPGDSVERHFMDTIEGSKWLADQDLAWTLVSTAIERVRELENELGCFFDRNPDGSVHQKAFAGQTFDRTVHKGDLTGIEIINRLSEQVWARGIERLEEHRAIELVKTPDGNALAGVLMIDMRDGGFVFVQARAVLLATGGGPTMYKYHTPSGDKSCDGMAMALRAGLALRDMEMVQFHPTGLLAGPGTRMTGTVLEEGLRGAGGHLLNGAGERFMAHYDERGERATRDIVSRGIFAEMRAGRTSPNGGVYISMAHLGADRVRAQFKGMVERCADCGFDLAGGRVEVVPTAHYMMGGVVFRPDCTTALTGLFAAGEDTGGVHGANRLGGNGVANSTVFGGIAGDSIAAWVQRHPEHRAPDETAIDLGIARHEAPFRVPPGNLEAVREALFDCMWEDVGVLRDAAGLARAEGRLAQLEVQLSRIGVADADRAFNLGWQDWINLKNLIAVSQVIARAAQAREDSRGAHFREDFPHTGDLPSSSYIVVRQDARGLQLGREAVRFTRVTPGGTLLQEAPPMASPAHAPHCGDTLPRDAA
jgi:fumarate reductase flavoprotein subunit